MLSLTRKTDYALVALTAIASEGREGPISARKLSESKGIPLPVLMNVLHHLLHSGLVQSIRGAHGGYFLAREPAAISLADIIRSLEGDIRMTLCCGLAGTGSSAVANPELGVVAVETGGEELSSCDMERHCWLRRPLQRINDRLTQFLEQISLEQICQDATASMVDLNMGESAAPLSIHSGGADHGRRAAGEEGLAIGITG